MHKVAIYTRVNQREQLNVLRYCIRAFHRHDFQCYLPEEIYVFLKSEMFNNIATLPYQKGDLKEGEMDYIVSIGGDGTFLATLPIQNGKNIPVLGVNAGRLGFLANVQMQELDQALHQLKHHQYTIQERSLLYFKNGGDYFENFPFALNDFTIHKHESTSMLQIDVAIDGEPLNHYWSDGIVLATHTGSTAYSLSCGGPILFPNAKSVVLTPVAPHHLNIRPVIIPDSQIISFKVRGRASRYLVSLDDRFAILDETKPLHLTLAPFYMKTILLNGKSFIASLREKLVWGQDSRKKL